MKLRLVKILLYASILVTCIAGIMAYVNYQFYKESTLKLEQANELMLRTSEVLSLMKDGETGTRGYILTQDSNYLEPFRTFEQQIYSYKLDLLKLSTNTLFEKDLVEIFRLISSKENLMLKTISLNDSLGREAALKLIKTNKGKLVMDTIRIEVAKMLQKEQQYLLKTSANYDAKLKTMNTFRYGIQAFVIIMTLLSIFTLTRKQKENERLIQKLNLANNSLEQKVTDRTKELHIVNLELQTQNEEITSQAEQIALQNEELTKLNEDKNKFIGIATHDLKSPLNRIKGFINIIQMSSLATVASQKEYFDMMLGTLTNMQNLISNLLDINKIDEGKHEFKKEQFDLVLFARESLQSFESQASEKLIKLSFNSDLASITIVSDKNILAQVLENLISNALKFSEKGTDVLLLIKSESSKIKITVQDHGPGISESEMNLLFGKFQKLSNRPTAGESSSGLGLSIVKDLVENLGGTIYCESIVGEGTSFIVEIQQDPNNIRA
jgi:signal transduction histidine kinase